MINLRPHLLSLALSSVAGALSPAARQAPLPRECTRADPAPRTTSHHEVDLSFTDDTLTFERRLVLPDLTGSHPVAEGRTGAFPGDASRTFLKTFGGRGVDVGNKIVRLDDGGYGVVGYTSSLGAGGEDVYLIRTNANGDTLWTRTYGGSGDDDGWDLARRSDGGFVISGFGTSWGAGGDDIILLGTDAAGHLQWKKTYGGKEDERSWGMAAMPDGGWVVAGQTRSRGAGDWDAYVVRTDQSGDSLWTRVFGGPGVDRALNVAVTPSGDIAVTGFTMAAPDADRDAFVALLSSDGTLRWDRTLHGSKNEVGHGIVLDTDGTILVTGYGNSWGAGDNDVVLWRLDAEGHVLSRRDIGKAGVDDRAMMTALSADGTLVVVGYVHGRDGDWEMSLWHATREGKVLAQRIFQNAGDDRGVFALSEGQGTVVVTGARAAGAGSSPDLLLARVNTPAG